MSRDRAKPRPLPLLVLACLAAVMFGALAALPVATPPRSPDHLLEWWDEIGTANAAISVVWVGGLALAGWLIAVSTIGLLVAVLDSADAVRVWVRVAPPSFRRALAAGVALSIATPSVGSATEGPITDVPLLIDLGAVAEQDHAPAPHLTDLGRISDPANPDADGDTASPTSPQSDEAIAAGSMPEGSVTDGSMADAPIEQWVVQAGDHLWKIAEDTLADRGEATDDRTVERYWRRLIDQNRDAIGPNADLIHTGLRLRLPD